MKEFVLDASYTLHWCFDDEATPQTESVLSSLQNQECRALVPHVWTYEVLNGLGKGIARGRLNREKGLLLWQEIRQLPIQLVDMALDERLLELALEHDLSIYDTSYLSLAISRGLAIATNDKKMGSAATTLGVALVAR